MYILLRAKSAVNSLISHTQCVVADAVYFDETDNTLCIDSGSDTLFTPMDETQCVAMVFQVFQEAKENNGYVDLSSGPVFEYYNEEEQQ